MSRATPTTGVAQAYESLPCGTPGAAGAPTNRSCEWAALSFPGDRHCSGREVAKKWHWWRRKFHLFFRYARTQVVAAVLRRTSAIVARVLVDCAGSPAVASRVLRRSLPSRPWPRGSANRSARMGPGRIRCGERFFWPPRGWPPQRLRPEAARPSRPRPISAAVVGSGIP